MSIPFYDEIIRKQSRLCPNELRRSFDYDPESGVLAWRQGPRAGQPAGGMKNGYLRVRIGALNVFAHRLAWLLHHGDWPAGVVDHINRDRIANLRDVSPTENARNKRRRGRAS